ncbi:MAG: hypothetical protein AAFY60_05920, partial [Myxococcota bacterium]
MKFGAHLVPDAWGKILPEDAQWLRPPAEASATCANCRMVRREEYRADCQCCTYYPEVPNFLLGMALEAPASRSLVERLIAEGHGLPTGFVPSPQTYTRAVIAYSKDNFGKDPDILCPFMDRETQDCGIYRYRNAVCSTFFCDHEHSESGERYWVGVQELVGHTEIALSQWLMDQLGFPAVAYVARLNSLAAEVDTLSGEDGSWSEPARRELWGDWFGREAEFYRSCAALVNTHRSSLFEEAGTQAVHLPLIYERAVRESIPDDAKASAPLIPESTGKPLLLDDLWYKLQLLERQLWQLPFNEGLFLLAPDVVVRRDERPFRLANEPPFCAERGKESLA